MTELFGLFGVMWWLDLLLVGACALLAGAGLGRLVMRRQVERALDAVHRRCWQAQDEWLAEHEARLHGLGAEADRLKALAQEAETREEALRREIDASRASHRQAEQALCQQLLGLDRQVAAEREAHRREIGALRDQTGLMRAEITQLLGLIEEGDGARALLQKQLAQAHAQAQAQPRALRRDVEGVRAGVAARPLLRGTGVTGTGAASELDRPEEAVIVGEAAMRVPAALQRGSDSPPPDDLERIHGIGPATQTWLNRRGVWYFRQIAEWQAGELRWLARHLPHVGHRAGRQDWIGQARVLAGLARPPQERRVRVVPLPPGAIDRRVAPAGAWRRVRA